MDETQFLALPEEQRKSLQRQWQAKGFYAGPIDGKSGDGTRAAIAASRTEQDNTARNAIRSQEIELEKLRLQQGIKKQSEEEEKSKKREKEADPLWDTFLPFAAGAGVGGLYGEMTNRGLDRFERGNVRALNEIARELGPTERLTSSQLNRARAAGAASAADRFAPSGLAGKSGGVTGRLLSYGIPAGVIYNEYTNYQNRANDPNLTDKERKSNQQIANALLGVTTGIGVEGGRRFFFPSREEGIGTSMMRVQTAREFANRMDDADTAASARRAATPLVKEPIRASVIAESLPALPPPSEPIPTPDTPQGPKPGTKAYMQQQARDLGIKGASRMTKAEIAERLAGAMKEHGGKRTVAKRITSAAGKTSPLLAPLLAGGIAYDAATSDAEAAGLSPSDARMRGLGTGAAAGAGTAGAIYGLSKAGPAVTRTLGRIVPPIAAGMTAYDVGNMAYGDVSSQMAPTEKETSARDELNSIEADLTSGDPMRVSAAKRSLAAMFRSETPEGERSLVERVTSWPAKRYASGLERQADELMPLPERNPVRADEMEIAAMRDRQEQQYPWSSWVDPEEKYNESAAVADLLANLDRQRANPTAAQLQAQALRRRFAI